jgi:hypothetical protein
MADMEGKDWRGAPGVPLVLFPKDHRLAAPPRLSTRTQAAIGEALEALAGLRRTVEHSTSRDGVVEEALRCASAALVAVVQALEPLLPGSEAVTVADGTNPHDAYMGVRRKPLTAEAAAAEMAVIMNRALADLCHAPLHWNDIVAETEAMSAVLARLSGTGAQDEDPRGTAGAGDAAGRAAFLPTGDGLERWILVHHLYCLFHLHAAAMVDAADGALAAGDKDVATAALAQATVYARGATAGMLHAGAVPARYYQEVIRPTMQPPATPMKLGGTMNPENTVYRAAIARFLERSTEPFPLLVREHPGLALARDTFLSADLLDIERHVAIAAMLVGEDRSLLQHERSSDNAVGILRRIRHQRAVRYCSLMRYGDRAVRNPLPAWAAG